MNTREQHLSAAIDLTRSSHEHLADGNHEDARSHAALAQAHAAVAQAWGDYEPAIVSSHKEVPPLPEWCGECDGPEPGRRVLTAPIQPGEENYPARVMWCPKCEPRSSKYQQRAAADA